MSQILFRLDSGSPTDAMGCVRLVWLRESSDVVTTKKLIDLGGEELPR
jgi:hypothetical protein